jgi:hypothetical protein
MAQTSFGDADDPREFARSFIERVAQWLNQPSHQEYFSQWRKI